MVEPASKNLQQILLGQKLCTAKDLRRCRGRVKRLSGDLPAFDSVWIDALVQAHKLTSYQAQAIETGQTDDLRIGPSVVLARLGGCVSETFLCRDVASSSLIVVKRASVAIELKNDTFTRLKALTDKARTIQHPGVVVPHALSEVGPSKTTKSRSRNASGNHWPGARVDLAVASRLVEGLSLSELLLRRGRFPEPIVLEIARQLLESLSVLHGEGIVHGQIELSNIRLQPSGQTILLDAGIATALQPELQISAFARPDRYDGIAPELIGTGRVPTPQSDLYALGVLLWQLLAGRPPFPTGDPLAKLASHQTQRISDVRELAPDTSNTLAECIKWLTELQPKFRPKSAKDVLVAAVSEPKKKDKSESPKAHSTIGLARRSGRSRLAGFSRTFQQPASRRLPKPSSPFPKFVAAAAAIVVLAALSVVGLHGRSRAWVLTEIPRLSLPNAITPPATPEATLPTSQVAEPIVVAKLSSQILPKPDAKGVIELDTEGPYEAGKILFPGRRLTLRGTAKPPARILVKNAPLWLRADEVVLQNIHVEFSPETESQDRDAEGAPAEPLNRLAEIWSQELALENCVFATTPSHNEPEVVSNPTKFQSAITWLPRNPNDSLPRKLSLNNTLLLGDFSTIGLVGRSHQILANNVLKTSGGPFFALETPYGQKDIHNEIELSHCTLRESGGVVSVSVKDGKLPTSIDLKLNATALALRPQVNQQGTSPLVLIIGNAVKTNWDERLTISGVDSVTMPGLTSYAISNREGTWYQRLPETTRRIRGLTSVEFIFRGDSLLARSDSFIDEFLTRLRSNVRPGILKPETTVPE